MRGLVHGTKFTGVGGASSLAAIFILTSLTIGLILYASVNFLSEHSGLGANVSKTNPDTGLELGLSLNSTKITLGQRVTIRVGELNTLSRVSVLPPARAWPVNGLTLTPCGTLNYPFGIEVLRGYYSDTNVSLAQPLKIFASTVYYCPVELQFGYYRFEPLSDNATLVTKSSSSGYPFSLPTSTTVTIDGYWTNKPIGAGGQVFERFSPGMYTVVAADEWGQILLLHFAVR